MLTATSRRQIFRPSASPRPHRRPPWPKRESAGLAALPNFGEACDYYGGHVHESRAPRARSIAHASSQFVDRDSAFVRTSARPEILPASGHEPRCGASAPPPCRAVPSAVPRQTQPILKPRKKNSMSLFTMRKRSHSHRAGDAPPVGPPFCAKIFQPTAFGQDALAADLPTAPGKQGLP